MHLLDHPNHHLLTHPTTAHLPPFSLPRHRSASARRPSWRSTSAPAAGGTPARGPSDAAGDGGRRRGRRPPPARAALRAPAARGTRGRRRRGCEALSGRGSRPLAVEYPGMPSTRPMWRPAAGVASATCFMLLWMAPSTRAWRVEARGELSLRPGRRSAFETARSGRRRPGAPAQCARPMRPRALPPADPLALRPSPGSTSSRLLLRDSAAATLTLRRPESTHICVYINMCNPAGSQTALEAAIYNK